MKYHIRLVEAKDKTHKEAQNSPCAFGSFCIIYEEKVIPYHPISKARFINVMRGVKS